MRYLLLFIEVANCISKNPFFTTPNLKSWARQQIVSFDKKKNSLKSAGKNQTFLFESFGAAKQNKAFVWSWLSVRSTKKRVDINMKNNQVGFPNDAFKDKRLSPHTLNLQEATKAAKTKICLLKNTQGERRRWGRTRTQGLALSARFAVYTIFHLYRVTAGCLCQPGEA